MTTHRGPLAQPREVVMKKVEVSELQGPLTELMSQLGGANGHQRLHEFKLWLKGVATQLVKIIRNRFNPTEFIGSGWSVIANETDVWSATLTELDVNQIQHVTMLECEPYITGEENLSRLKASGNIRLDADVFYTLWTNQSLIPESWKEKIDGDTRVIFFDGTVFQNPDGYRCVLYLYWYVGEWLWDVSWLDSGFDQNFVSAVLASST